MKAMILAAGLGTRLRPYSLERPKPLFPVLNRPLLSHIVQQLHRAGFGSLVVNAHYLQEQIALLLRQEDGIILQEEKEILGTGGGLRQALPHFKDQPVLVVNGDLYHTIDLAAVYREHCRSGAAVTLVMHDYPRFNQVMVDGAGRIRGFGVAGPPGASARLAFTGIHVIDPAVLELIPPETFYSIIDCYRTLLSRGGVIRAFEVRDHFWTDMGSPADYLALHAALLTGPLRGKDPAVAGPMLVGAQARLEPGVALEHWVAIGAGARIGRNAKLTRTVVWDGAEVEADAVLADTIVTR